MSHADRVIAVFEKAGFSAGETAFLEDLIDGPLDVVGESLDVAIETWGRRSLEGVLGLLRQAHVSRATNVAELYGALTDWLGPMDPNGGPGYFIAHSGYGCGVLSEALASHALDHMPEPDHETLMDRSEGDLTEPEAKVRKLLELRDTEEAQVIFLLTGRPSAPKPPTRRETETNYARIAA